SGAIRAVVAPSSIMSLAFDRGDGTSLCMEAPLPPAAKSSTDGDEIVKSLVAEVLEKRLIGANGATPRQGEVVDAFRASVIMAEGWLRLGVVLTANELSIAEKNQRPKGRTWTCNNPR